VPLSPRLLVAAALLSGVGFLAAEAAGLPALAIASKPIPVLALALLQRRAPPGRHAGWIAAGLLASALGDVLLEWSPSLFVPGLLAFLSAHVAYVIAFTLRAPRPATLLVGPIAGYGIAMFTLLRPGLGDLAVPVAVYVLVICAMAWRAAALVGAVPAPAAWSALLGAGSFVVSDSVLAVNRFHEPVPHAGLLIMATYWAGQAGIAASSLVPGEPRR
jgi:alkenylglycerophosphocholine/alkenylglycerophosphoethanolamine hydrolase